MRYYAAIFLLFLLAGCIKNKDYTPLVLYDNKVNSLTMTLSVDSLPADGASKDTINLFFLKNDTNDSLNIAQLSLTVTTSAGTFVPNGLATLTLSPTYKLDSARNLNLTAQVILQSSTKTGPAQLRITYSSVEVDTSLYFYRVYPDNLVLTTSSLATTPDFKTTDTIYAQLSKKGGTPSQGDSIRMVAFDASFTNALGIINPTLTKSNATGLGVFTFVLGDAAINNINYTGTINLIGTAANGASGLKDTIKIYSR
jgi:hypothetical protein